MLVPVESKQIAYCSYNENESTLHVYYHTGEVVAYPAVDKADYEALLESPNRYDALIKVAQKGCPAAAGAASGLGADVWPDI